jgi:putative Mg2+ transporter-C (MgtC) family protein
LRFLVSEVPSLSGWASLLRLLVAAGLGAVVGFERELRDREAGIRTHLLVSLGAALFTIVSAYGFHEFLTSGGNIVRTDPTRIAAQIVTGVGFLGAGAILREGLSVRGLTTAATLWIVAAIGMASGAGYYWPAVAGTALTVLALGPLRMVAHRTVQQIRPDEHRLLVELREGQPIGALLAQLGDEVLQYEFREEQDRRVLHLQLRRVDEALLGRLSDLDYVTRVQWRR